MSLNEQLHLERDIRDILGEFSGRDAADRDMEPYVRRFVDMIEVERSKVLLRMPDLKNEAGMRDVFGKWPGNETDKEIDEAMKEIE